MPIIIGNNPKLVKQCSCRKCSAIMTYTLVEVKERVECDYGGGRENVTYIECPRCGNEISVDNY